MDIIRSNLTINEYKIQDGLNLSLIQAQPVDGIVLDYEDDTLPQAGIGLSFYQAGAVCYQLGSTGLEHWFKPGQNVLINAPLQQSVSIRLPGQPGFTSVQFFIQPAFFELWEEKFQGKSFSVYWQLLQQDPHLATFNTTRPMQEVLYQILSCPYEGALKKMFFEAKCLELMTIYLACLSEQSVSYSNFRLNSADINHIQEARELLIQNMTNPPTLLELCRLVGLNEHKLQYGFRELFGTTVFEYLQNFKMEQARLALDQKTLNIGQIAAQVGYSNFSHFSAAFKRKYGISPRAYTSTNPKAALAGYKNSLIG